MSTAPQKHQPDFGTGEKKLSIYIVGMILCIALTLMPFAVVMYSIGDYIEKLTVIFSAAIVQFLVQVICFLRLNYSTEQARMNVMSFIFAIVVLFVIVAGSLWIMWSLNYRMVH